MSNVQLSEALNQLLGGQANAFQPSVTDVSQDPNQVDPNQLFNDLIHGAMSTRGTFNLQAQPGDPLHLGHLSNQHPVESAVTAQALRNGADPTLLNKAAQYLGKNAYLGLCEAFVERMTQGKEGIYSSAIDAWNRQTNKQRDLKNVQPGDSVYFAPDASNQGYGHTGVYMGGNKFVSATYNGIRQYDINDWQKQTGQKPLGFVPSAQHTSIPKQQMIQPAQSMQSTMNVGKPQQPLSMAQRQQAFTAKGGKGDLPVGFNG